MGFAQHSHHMSSAAQEEEEADVKEEKKKDVVEPQIHQDPPLSNAMLTTFGTQTPRPTLYQMEIFAPSPNCQIVPPSQMMILSLWTLMMGRGQNAHLTCKTLQVHGTSLQVV